MSFRDEVTLNFEATKDKTFENSHIVEVTPGVRLLRFAMIYGANASGKSNLLYALEFLRNFVFEKTTDLEEQTGTTPFKLDAVTPQEPSEFSLKYYLGDTKYWYELKDTANTLSSVCGLKLLPDLTCNADTAVTISFVISKKVLLSQVVEAAPLATDT